MFDLTQEVVLEPIWQKRYQWLRWILCLTFVISGFFFAYHILFPSQYFSLNLALPKDKNNTLHFDTLENKSSLFSAYSNENFSNISLQLIANKNSSALQGKRISIRKTYKAFTYPIATQPAILSTISAENNGLANGTLLSFNNSVFAVVDGKVMPLDNPSTFLSLGYSWEDVRPASEDEIGLFDRDKLFTIDQPHPNGTIFLARDTSKYYLINDGQKQEITGNYISIYLKQHPVTVDEKSLNFDLSCELKKNLWPFNSYGCSISIENLAQFLGNDYQVAIDDIDVKKIKQVDFTFSRNINWNNMRDTLSDIKHKALINYGFATPY
jgi:hypothetical protein